MATSDNLGFDLIEQGQAGAHVTANAALSDIDTKLGAGFTANGFLQLASFEVELAMTGATVTATALIPARAIVLGVTSETVDAITGAASYDVGVSGGSEYGATLGITAASVNVGVVGPSAIYADQDVDVTANGGSFTGGTVRLIAHALVMGVRT